MATLTRTDDVAWRTEPPTREQLKAAAALCFLVYWWNGPEQRSWEALQGDAKKELSREKELGPPELAPDAEAGGGGLVYEFQDRNQVHKCVKAVMESVHPEGKIVMWQEKVNAAVLREPDRIVVFFRGTKDTDEMVNDATLTLVPYELPGRDKVHVHKGFLKHVNQCGGREKLITCILAAIDELSKASTGTKPVEVLVTGHSLGGAAATLIAAALDAALDASVACKITLITFGSPRVGSKAFKAAVDSSARLRHYRVQNELDICTRFPWWMPFPGLYQHTGHHVWLHEGKVTWQPDGAFYAASRPMNVLAYPFRFMFNANAADIRVHQMGGKLTRGYCIHLAEWEWAIPAPASERI